MSAPPDVTLHFDPPWFSLPITEDEAAVEAAARDIGASAWLHAGVAASESQVGWLTSFTLDVRAMMASRPLIGLFLLIPEPETGVSAAAGMTAIDVGSDLSVDQLLAGMTEDVGDLAGVPETASLHTAAGPAYKLRQRATGSSGAVSETVQYLWAFPERQAALVLGIGFTDLLESKRWAALCDELAAGLVIEDEQEQ